MLTRVSKAIGNLTVSIGDEPDLDTLLEICADAIADVAGFDGIFLSAADPMTLQFSTMTHVRDLPPEMCAPFMRNEFLEDDVNKFTHLGSRGLRVSTLRDATFGQERLSSRYREIYRPYGFGPEMRARLSDGRACWGYATLVREAGSPDFTGDDVAAVDQMCAPLALALRDSHKWSSDPTPKLSQPGTIIVDGAGTFVSVSDRAKDTLELICAAPVHAIASSTLARAQGRQGPPPKARLRTADGTWLTIRGDAVRDADGQATHASIVLEAAPSTHVASILARAYGLSSREEAVLGHLARGEGTRAIGQQLFISEHTVRDHVKAIFGKTGCRSRGELIHRFLSLDP